MARPLKLVSLNIEAHRHLEERVLPFLVAERPDFVSLQEVFEVDMPLIEETLGMKGRFVPQANVTETSIHIRHALGKWGLAQFTALPIVNQESTHCVGTPDRLPVFLENGNPNGMNRVLLWTKVEHEGQHFTFATTHFTISPKGQWTQEQQDSLEILMSKLDVLPEVVLSGDFNAPRGGKIFAQLAERYIDNIPPEVTTSLDGQFHKGGYLELMVDGLFTTPEYQANDVQVIGGVSDHKAIVAEISK
jgi:endonuclease/exonuclease/phosphatase family metal-dependent hydrolase